MIATLLTKTLIAAIVLIILIVVNGKRILLFKTYLALFFIVYFSDNLLMVLTIRYRYLQLIPLHVWEGFLICNWSGKLYSIVFTLILLYFTRKLLTWDEIGLTFHQNKGSLLPSVIVILTLAGWAALVGINSPKGTFDLMTLLYLAVMPALNEELVYRGGLLGLLDKLMPNRINFLGARIGWGALLTSIIFCLLHGFSLDNNLNIHIELIALRNSFISGFIFAWLKERTGSLLMPVIAHGMEDFLFFLPRMI
jgi:membrane protease YdiL (CAAX protease family)